MSTEQWELLANQAIGAAGVMYFLALLAHLVEWSNAVSRRTSTTASEPVAAMSGAASPGPTAPGVTDPARDERRQQRVAMYGRLGFVLTVFGLVCHAGSLFARGMAAERVPWGNMYEFVITLSFVGAVTWLVLVARRPALRLIGLFVTIALVVILGFAGVVLYTDPGPLVPALNSYWLKIHVSAAASASGILLIAFVPTALFLVRSGYDQGKTRFPYPIGAKLPAADSLERLSFRLHAFAFPIWTLAIICGAIWAEGAWGRYWGWDPKEVWSFISWVAYAAYLHARATPSVKRTTASWLVVVAWGTMLINLYVINFVGVGLHSYAGTQ